MGGVEGSSGLCFVPGYLLLRLLCKVAPPVEGSLGPRLSTLEGPLSPLKNQQKLLGLCTKTSNVLFML